MFCTAALVLSVLMLAAESKPRPDYLRIRIDANLTLFATSSESKLTPIAPLGFGFMLWAVELFSVEYTGGAIK